MDIKNSCMVGWTGKQKDSRMDKKICMDRKKNGQMVGWMDKKIDVWLEGKHKY